MTQLDTTELTVGLKILDLLELTRKAHELRIIAEYKQKLIKKLQGMKKPFDGSVHGGIGNKCPTCIERTDCLDEVEAVIKDL